MQSTRSESVQRPLDRFNLRLDPATFEAIDVALARRPGNISRNTWITEAIQEKLARESDHGRTRPRK
jgi:predicted HicB family RNase H-like nuclease